MQGNYVNNYGNKESSSQLPIASERQFHRNHSITLDLGNLTLKRYILLLLMKNRIFSWFIKFYIIMLQLTIE